MSNRTETLRESHKNYKKEKAGIPAKSNHTKPGGPKTNRTRHLALRVTEETGAAVDKAAYETHRTSSNWVECAILWALNEGAVKTRQLVPRPQEEK